VNEGKVDINHFEIVQKARSDYEVQIREAFLIRKLKPEINKQMYQSGASYFVESRLLKKRKARKRQWVDTYFALLIVLIIL
jgi:hypothetical protein